MDENLKRDMDRTIERGKAETEEMRAEVLAQSDDARADLDNRAAQAEGEVREHFDEVRGEAAQQLSEDEASQLGSTVEREREAAEDRLVQMLDAAREREASHESAGERIAQEAKGFFASIRNKLTGGH